MALLKNESNIIGHLKKISYVTISLILGIKFATFLFVRYINVANKEKSSNFNSHPIILTGYTA